LRATTSVDGGRPFGFCRRRHRATSSTSTLHSTIPAAAKGQMQKGIFCERSFVQKGKETVQHIQSRSRAPHPPRDGRWRRSFALDPGRPVLPRSSGTVAALRGASGASHCDKEGPSIMTNTRNSQQQGEEVSQLLAPVGFRQRWFFGACVWCRCFMRWIFWSWRIAYAVRLSR